MSSVYIHNYFTAEKNIIFDKAITEGQFTDYWNIFHLWYEKEKKKIWV